MSSQPNVLQSDATVLSEVEFADIYTKYYRRVYSHCLRMTGNVADAEDLAHDVFIQVSRKFSSFRGDSAFTTWLFRITVNQVLMYFRKRSVRSEKTTETGEMPEKIDQVVINKQSPPIIDRIGIATAVAQLPGGYRTVFLLHDVEGYEHHEIGEILNISDGTSKSQLHKARYRLRELLNKRIDNLEVEEADTEDLN